MPNAHFVFSPLAPHAERNDQAHDKIMFFCAKQICCGVAGGIRIVKASESPSDAF